MYAAGARGRGAQIVGRNGLLPRRSLLTVTVATVGALGLAWTPAEFAAGMSHIASERTPKGEPPIGSVTGATSERGRTGHASRRVSNRRPLRLGVIASGLDQIASLRVEARLAGPARRARLRLTIGGRGARRATTVTRTVRRGQWTLLALDRPPDGRNRPLTATLGSAGKPVRVKLRKTRFSASPSDPGASSPPTGVDGGTGSGATTWRLLWSDEFSGQSIDGSNWRRYHNTYGDSSHQLACLTPDNVTVANGVATITSRRQTVTCPGGSTRQYTSGFLSTREIGRFFPLFGRFEIRARLPHGQGMWPAFWLRHVNGASAAEVDIMEYFHNSTPGSIAQVLHFPTTLGKNVAKRRTPFETPTAGTGGWHTYAVEIEPVTGADATTDVRFRFSVDGVTTLDYVNSEPEPWSQVDPQRAWDIAVNTAVGGDWVGHPEQQLGYLPALGQCSLTRQAPMNSDPATCPTETAGVAIRLPQLPAGHQVDYVRVFVR